MKSLVSILCTALVMTGGIAGAQSPPTPPVTVDLTVDAPLCTFTISTQTALNNYLNNVAGQGCGGKTGPFYGDLAILALGTYAPSGSMILPVPHGTAGTHRYVTFRSANYSSLPPPGTRVHHGETIRDSQGNVIATMPDDSVNMPRFNAARGKGTFNTVIGANHYRFQGLNLTAAAGVLADAGFLFYSHGTDSSIFTDHMIIDRCLIHGDPTLFGARNAVAFGGSHMAILDSQIYDGTIDGGEYHSVLMSTGTGPYLVRNNDIEAETIGIFIGDSSVDIPGVIPADITILGNWIHRPPTRNPFGFIYNTGTSSISSDGLTITLATGTPSRTWADGSLGTVGYLLLDPANRSLGGYGDQIPKIDSVNVGTKTLTLHTAMKVKRGTSGNAYRITLDLPRGAAGAEPYGVKNAIEVKHGNRIDINGNIIDTTPHQAQKTALIPASVHGLGASSTDINFRNNYVRATGNGIAFLMRPVTGQGTQWTAQVMNAMPSGPRAGRVRVTTNNTHLLNTGDTVDINGGTGTREATGHWTITVETSTSFTIPVTFVHASNGTEAVNGWQTGAPTSRIAVTNNVFEDIASSQAINFAVGDTYTWLTFSQSFDFSDGNLSTTGSWQPTDWLIEHNTVVSPATNIPTGGLWNGIQWSGAGISGNTYTVLKMKNFTFRNNLVYLSDPVAAGSGHRGVSTTGPGTGSTTGSAALNEETDSTTRIFSKNVFYNATANDESRTFSVPESTNNTWIANQTGVGFTSLVNTGNMANYLLTGASPYKGTATDGTDPGITLALPAILANVITGAPGPP